MPSFVDLREFIRELEKRGDLVRITAEVDPHLEMTEIADRTLRGGGPALLFENPKGADIPVLANLFGAERRVAALHEHKLVLVEHRHALAAGEDPERWADRDHRQQKAEHLLGDVDA